MAGRNSPFHDLLTYSAIISLLFVVLSTLWQWEKPIPAYHIGKYFAGSVFYVFPIVQAVSFIILLAMIWLFIPKGAIVVVALSLLLFGLELYYGNFFAERSFAHLAIQPEIFEEPYPLNVLSSKYTSINLDLENNSSPSGFALRQWVITLAALSLLFKHRETTKKKRDWSKGLKIFFVSSFVYVALARVFRQAHVPLNIAIGICLGTVVTFLCIFIISAISQTKIDKKFYHFYVAFAIVSLILFMSISNNPFFWIWALLSFIIIVGVLCKSQRFIAESR